MIANKGFPLFCHSAGCLFTKMTVSFVLQKHCCFMWSHLSIVGLNAHATGILFRKFFPVLLGSSILPTSSFTRFGVSGIMLGSLIHLKLSFVQSKRQASSFVLLCVATQYDQHHSLKMLPFHQCAFLTRWLQVNLKVCVLNSILSVSVSGFISVPCSVV